MRTKFDPNEIILHADCAEIVLYDLHNQEKARAVIDYDAVKKVADAKWYQRPDGYVATNNYRGRGYTYLHSAILDKSTDSTYVDHRDGDRLNNRAHNLRIADYSQNGFNKRLGRRNKSGRVGVHWSKSNGKWCAMIKAYGYHKNLGYFDNFEDAVRCREAAEREYFGDFKADNERVSK